MGYKFAFLLAVLAAVTDVLYGCDLDAVTSCLTDFASTSGQVSGLPMSYSIDELCSNYNTLTSCVGSSADGCSEETVLGWNTIDGTLAFTCTSESREVFRTNSECLASAESDNSECTVAYLRATTQDPTNLCSNTNTYIGCVVRVYQAACGRDVAEWIVRYLDASLDPVERFSGCDFNPASYVSTAPGLSSLSVLTLVSLLILRLLSVE